MDSAIIQDRVDDLSRAMLAKGLINPRAYFRFEAHCAPLVYMHWEAPGHDHGVNEICRDPSVEGALDAAFALVRNLPSAEETKRQNFMTALAKLIDLGRENGIEVDFINPLTEMMKRLSENALTYQPGRTDFEGIPSRPSDYTDANLADFDDGNITP